MSIEHHCHEETRVLREKPQTLLHQVVSNNFSRIDVGNDRISAIARGPNEKSDAA
jgi:hypothetical protein